MAVNLSDIASRLVEIRKKAGKNQEEFAELIGISRSVLSQIEVRKINPSIELIASISSKLNIPYSYIIDGVIISEVVKSASGGIPLIVDVTAIAGFGNAKFAIQESDIKDYYVIPEFKHKHIDFMIKVDGNSMYPNYNSGDIVACRIIRNRTFIQWNKTHVIATKEQGIIIKRITPGQTDDAYTIVSDNVTFPEFQMPKSEVDSIALVVGVIRFE